METTNQNQTPAQEVPENLTPQQALAILVQGVQFAQTKGIYSLTDAELISKAVRVFTNQPEEGKEAASPEGLTAEEAPVPAEPISETVEETVEEPVAEMAVVADETVSEEIPDEAPAPTDPA